MHKNTFRLIVVFATLGLAGVFIILAKKEEVNRVYFEQERKLRARKMCKDINKMIELVNGSKR